jgi:hypothetical protein
MFSREMRMTDGVLTNGAAESPRDIPNPAAV